MGLVGHPASVTTAGLHAIDLLDGLDGVELAAVFGPEHGFLGRAGAGEEVGHTLHPRLGIPVHSLYGEQRRPSPDMLDRLDILVVDLQDLGVRCYTYAATLKGILEAAEAAGVAVLVADRPVPLPEVIDGPVRAAGIDSFVAPLDLPLVYGMTPGETALWMCRHLDLHPDLTVLPLEGYRRAGRRDPAWGPWIPPSPGIRSWEAAQVYPATVFSEALPVLDVNRSGLLPFQVVGAPWIESDRLLPRLTGTPLDGVAFHPALYEGQGQPYEGQVLQGVRLVVTDPATFRPVQVAVHLLHALQDLYGPERIWDEASGARPEFFDLLTADPAVRQALLDGTSPAEITTAWEAPLEAFRTERADMLLYEPHA